MTVSNTTAPVLPRKLGLFHGTVLNMIDMVGIGPFVVLPIVIGQMGGHFMYAWLAGALLALVDAMIWSELGAAYPLAGGSYNFLKEAYGHKGPGRIMSFMYVWQTMIQAPLVAASAAIGFAQYLGYLVPMEVWQQKMVSGMVIVFVLFLLYRRIDSIGRIGVLLWVGVLFTMGWIILGGFTRGDLSLPFSPMMGVETPALGSALFFAALGHASVKTIYSYLGYYNVCHLGGEMRNPARNIPRSMFISVLGIAVLYLLMNWSVTSVIAWPEIAQWQKTGSHPFVVSTFIERLYGASAAKLATVMILWVALASLFAVMLGYTRVPYAAAADGAFFPVFARLHPTRQFPYISLLVLGGLAFVFSLLFKMSEVISGILAMRIIVQFIAQSVGVVLLRRKRGTAALPWTMPLYPVPIVLAIACWLFVFFSAGQQAILFFLIIFGAGIVAYGLYQWWRRGR